MVFCILPDINLQGINTKNIPIIVKIYSFTLQKNYFQQFKPKLVRKFCRRPPLGNKSRWRPAHVSSDGDAYVARFRHKIPFSRVEVSS
jgi:hypothetical protein